MELLLHLLHSGWNSLEYYVLKHTLTCLLPAFLLAGAMVTFLNREAVLDLLGEQASTFTAFALAAMASFLVAACSCTVIPVAAGLYFAGAGIGVAFIILWVAPAANILALVYTGTILGAGMVTARVVAALLVAFLVGWVMRSVFGSEQRDIPAANTASDASTPSDKHSEPVPLMLPAHLVLIVLILASLLGPNYLVQEGPYIYKILVWFVLTAGVALYAWTYVDRSQIAGWLRETGWFIKMIFPLLLGGVFLVGIIQAILPAEWVQQWLGDHSLRAAFLATLIGAVSYFATMTEAPFVHALMEMGMGPGPALALLLTGPGISLPNWLAIARIFGVRKALVYVPVIMVLGALAGWIFGLILH